MKEQPEYVDETVEFMGKDVDPAQLKNPHLRRVVSRVSQEEFKHRYGDHSRKAWAQYGDYSRDSPKVKYHETYFPEPDEGMETGYQDYGEG